MRGGYLGRVKMGIHMDTGKRVAIKIIPKVMIDPASKTAPNPDSNKKLEREITIMKLLKHPNVMELYDVYETNKEL